MTGTLGAPAAIKLSSVALMTDVAAPPVEPSAAPDPETLWLRDIRLTWRTLVALGIPEPYLMELCVDALRSVERDARGHRDNDAATRRAVYEAAVMQSAHFGRPFVNRREVPHRLAGIALGTQERELLQALSDGIAELSLVEQECLRLFDVEAYTLEDIGEMLAVPTEFAKAQLHDARRRLRRSRAAAGRPIQRDALFAMMRVWHNPDDATIERVRTATLRALRRGGAGTRRRWLGPAVAVALSIALLAGLWLLGSELSQGR